MELLKGVCGLIDYDTGDCEGNDGDDDNHDDEDENLDDNADDDDDDDLPVCGVERVPREE